MVVPIKLHFSPTIAGVIALILWATSSAAAMSLRGIPEFELLTLMFLGSFLLGAIITAITGKWDEVKQVRPFVVFSLVGGIVGQQIIYMCALQQAPPAEVDIIAYLWPIMAVTLSAILLKTRLSMMQIAGLIMGFTGVALVTYMKLSFDGIASGHYLALLSAICWGLYSVLVKELPRVTISLLGVVYGIGFCLVLPCHLYFESFVYPTIKQWLFISYFSVILSVVAYVLWTRAMQLGKSISITISAYAKPIASMILLCSLGYAEISWSLGVATLLVFFAGICSRGGGEIS